MSKVIAKANLSEADIDKIIRAVNKVNTDINEVRKEILIKLAEFTRDTARTTLDLTTNKQYSTQHLKYSIQIEYDFENYRAKVITNEPYAQFVEFGTGVIGKNGNYDFSSMNINSVSYTNGHWTYILPKDKVKSNRKMTKKEEELGGVFIRTNGQQPHRFMLQALQELKKNYKRIAKEVLIERGLI